MLLQKDFQDHIPYGNWMYPVIDGVEGDSDFYKYAPAPNSLDRVYGSAEDKAYGSIIGPQVLSKTNQNLRGVY